MLPMDAVGRERVLFALGGCGIAQCSIVREMFAGLPSVGSLHPDLGRREPNFRYFQLFFSVIVSQCKSEVKQDSSGGPE